MKIPLLYRMHLRSCILVVAWSCRPQLVPRHSCQRRPSLVRRQWDLLQTQTCSFRCCSTFTVRDQCSAVAAATIPMSQND